jgi:predicted GIY-YIG superfamily endonuclease
MIGGIDQQIQQRVDAYRDNPQQLMQRYQQNQELIDLLAMQKLKSEKDAAAREIQMQMQTTPQTIKQQREAELLGRTKDEMVKQTSGIMQERQKRQQQNMQRTANQGLPQLPAGNMQRMAGGGIVAFAGGGGPLQQEDINAQLRQQIEAALELGASPEDLAERLKDNPNALAILRSVQSQQIDRQASMGERPAEAMSIPDRAPSIDTTDIMSILNPSKPTKPVEKVVPPTRLPEKEPSAPAMGERPEEARSLPRPSTRPVSAPVTPGPSIDTTNLASLLGPKPTPPYNPREEGGGLSSLLGASGVIDPVQRLQDRKAALADRDQLAEKITAQREQQRQERLESSPLGGPLFKLIIVLTRR